MKRYLLLLWVIIPVFVRAQEDYLSKKLSEEQCLTLAEQNKKNGDIKEASRYINTAAMMYWEKKDYPPAIRLLNESIDLNRQISNASGIAKLQSNLGMIYSDLRDFEKSLYYFQMALDYRLKYGEKSEIISTYINKAVVLNSLKRHAEAAQGLEEALRLATEMNDATQMKSCYGMLAETYQKTGDQEKTLHYYNLYATFHEMVQRDKVNEANRETEKAKLKALELELAKKEKELELITTSRELKETESQLENVSSEVMALLANKSKQELAMRLIQRELELDQLQLSKAEARNREQRTWIIAGIIGLVLLSLFAIVLYRNYRFKKKTNRQLAEQNDKITSMNENLESQVQERTSALRQTMANLEKRNRDLDQFSHVISHNLRGPVASILGLGKIINRKNPEDPLNAEVFERLLVATGNLDTVVRDLSTILQVQDEQTLPAENILIAETLATVKNQLKDTLEHSKAILQTDQVLNTHVKTVKPYFESILFNLLSNAVKYSERQDQPVIKITTQHEGNNFILKVADNGIGIAQADLGRIFEPFKRFTTLGEGRGLGLYLVRTQVEAMRGTIQVASEVGKGTEFTVSLPQKE